MAELSKDAKTAFEDSMHFAEQAENYNHSRAIVNALAGLAMTIAENTATIKNIPQVPPGFVVQRTYDDKGRYMDAFIPVIPDPK
jgi:hypothetical protein